ncbi:hypothetical protein Ancab_011362 [Ancistrocladus abbreviatus]
MKLVNLNIAKLVQRVRNLGYGFSRGLRHHGGGSSGKWVPSSRDLSLSCKKLQKHFDIALLRGLVLVPVSAQVDLYRSQGPCAPRPDISQFSVQPYSAQKSAICKY